MVLVSLPKLAELYKMVLWKLNSMPINYILLKKETPNYTAQKIKFSVKENFIFCAVLAELICNSISPNARGSRSQIFFKIGVLKNFANFTGKHPCRSLFLIKSQARRPTALLKRDSNTCVSLWNLWNLWTPFFTEHL